MKQTNRILVVILLAMLSFILIGTTFGFFSTKTPEACQEDQKCWDCETLGNKVCGPVNVELFPNADGTRMVRVWDSHNRVVFGPVLLERIEE